MLSKQKTMEALETMYGMFPEAHGELKHNNPFELLIAVILSAQATDVSVNKATPDLFASFPTPDALAEASIDETFRRTSTNDKRRIDVSSWCRQKDSKCRIGGCIRDTSNRSRYPRGTCLKTPEDLQTRCYGHGSRRNTDAESTTRIMGKDTSYTDFFW